LIQLRCALFPVLIFLILLPTTATSGPDDNQRPLVRQILEEMPSQLPTGCVGAAMTISALLPTVSVLAASEDTTGFAGVMQTMENFIHATEAGPRRYLAIVLVGCAGMHARWGRPEDAYRQLGEVHDQVMSLHAEVQTEVHRLEDPDEEMAVYPETGCLLTVGVGVVHHALGGWQETAERLGRSGLNETQQAHLDAMSADLLPLEPEYATLAQKVDRLMK